MCIADKLAVYAIISLTSSFVFALVFVCVLTWTLPSNDEAYGQAPLQDSVSMLVTIVAATASAVVVWPLYSFCGWHSSPARVAFVAAGFTLLYIIVVTPFDLRAGWLGSYVVLAATLITHRVRMGRAKNQAVVQ
ncbi:MAG: hypothetical protein AAF417_23815 [Pseudomonadota bacterium]